MTYKLWDKKEALVFPGSSRVYTPDMIYAGIDLDTGQPLGFAGIAKHSDMILIQEGGIVYAVDNLQKMLNTYDIDPAGYMSRSARGSGNQETFDAVKATEDLNATIAKQRENSAREQTDYDPQTFLAALAEAISPYLKS